MKIAPSASPLPATQNTASTKKVAPDASASTVTNTSTSAAKSRISQWFTRVGVAANLSYANANDRAKAVSQRNRLREEQKLANLSAIMDMALDVAISDVSNESIDPDWFYSFTDLAENIYSPDMQELWGKILAVEISRPGSFSLNTLETLRKLTQRDAKIFALACRLSSKRVGDPIPRIITDYHQRKTLTNWFVNKHTMPVNLANFGLSYPSLLTLFDLGLIVSNEIESAEFPLHKSVLFRCGEKNYQIKAKRNGVALAYYKFTSMGAELAKLTKRHEHPEYLEELKRVLTPAFVVNAQL